MTIATIVGGLAVAAIAGVLAIGMDSSRREPATTPPGMEHFTIGGASHHGIWELAVPQDRELDPLSRRPQTGVRWLGEGTVVQVGCVARGVGYVFAEAGRRERWHWWAHLVDGGWVPMAAFREANADGSQGVELC